MCLGSSGLECLTTCDQIEWSLFRSAWTRTTKGPCCIFWSAAICWSDIWVPPRQGYYMWTLSCKNKAGFFFSVPEWQLHSHRSRKRLNPFVPLWIVDSLLSSWLGWVRMRSNFKVAFVLILAMSPCFCEKSLSFRRRKQKKKKTAFKLYLWKYKISLGILAPISS